MSAKARWSIPGRRRGGGIEQAADRLHGADDTLRFANGEGLESLGKLGIRSPDELIELDESPIGDNSELATSIRRIWSGFDQAIALEALEDSAQIGRIKLQITCQGDGADAVVGADLEQDARIRQGKRRIEICLIQNANEICVEAVEIAGSLDEGGIGHGSIS
jgi:hypothetical protein